MNAAKLSYLVFLSLTGGHTVEANINGGGSHWSTLRQAAQHRLHRVAFGVLAVEGNLLVQLHRLNLHVALW